MGDAIWIYGGSSGGKRSRTLWCISDKLHDAETGGKFGVTGASLPPNALSNELSNEQRGLVHVMHGFRAEEVVQATGKGQEQGPGDVMWHAAASLFDRFLVIYGGRRAPPRGAAAEKPDSGIPGCRSAPSHVHVFDTVTRRWVPFSVEGNADIIVDPCPRFRHTLNPIGNATVLSTISSQQVLVVLGGMPSKLGGSNENCWAVEPFAIVCTWQCSASGIGESGQGEKLVDGQMRDENAEVGVLKLAWRKIIVNDSTNSWIGSLGRGLGWIGHSCTEDSMGGLLVYGGTHCAWTGPQSCVTSTSDLQAVLHLRLRQDEADLMLDVSELMPGGSGDVPVARFGHAACVLKSGEGKRDFVIHGGCVELKVCAEDTVHGSNAACKEKPELEMNESQRATRSECDFVHLLDLRTRLWRKLPLHHASRNEGSVPRNRTRTCKKNGAGRLAMVSAHGWCRPCCFAGLVHISTFTITLCE